MLNQIILGFEFAFKVTRIVSLLNFINVTLLNDVLVFDRRISNKYPPQFCKNNLTPTRYNRLLNTEDYCDLNLKFEIIKINFLFKSVLLSTTFVE
jgi:hypothetical protein